MTDYNDGEWHGWNGGECPVHPESIVDTWDEETKDAYHGYKACDIDWSTGGCFRVITPYVDPQKPREFWVNEYKWGLGEFYMSKAEADGNRAGGRIRRIHLIEAPE